MPAFRTSGSSTTSSSPEARRPHSGAAEILCAERHVLRAGTDFGHRPAGPRAYHPAVAHNDNPTRIRAARMVLVSAGRVAPDGSDLLGAVGLRSRRLAKCLVPHACRFVGGWHPLPRRAPFVAANPCQHRHGRFMVVGLRQLKLYKFSSRAGAPTRGIAAAPERKASRGSSMARRIAAHTANGVDFSTVPGASRSCARDSADPLIRPCQAHRSSRPSRASRCGQTVDEKKR